jgi:hypothetical protein
VQENFPGQSSEDALDVARALVLTKDREAGGSIWDTRVRCRRLIPVSTRMCSTGGGCSGAARSRTGGSVVFTLAGLERCSSHVRLRRRTADHHLARRDPACSGAVMTRRGRGRRADAERQARLAKAARDATREARERAIEKALADYFEARAQAQAIKAAAREKADAALADGERAAAEPMTAVATAIRTLRRYPRLPGGCAWHERRPGGGNHARRTWSVHGGN